MSTFEILFLILVAIFVFSSLYFAISGRIRTIASEEKNDERYFNQANWDDQIKVLTVRIGEICTENQRLNNVVREWMNVANTYKVENDKLNKSLEEWQKQTEEYKAKLYDADNELKKFTAAQDNA